MKIYQVIYTRCYKYVLYIKASKKNNFQFKKVICILCGEQNTVDKISHVLRRVNFFFHSCSLGKSRPSMQLRLHRTVVY